MTAVRTLCMTRYETLYDLSWGCSCPNPKRDYCWLVNCTEIQVSAELWRSHSWLTRNLSFRVTKFHLQEQKCIIPVCDDNSSPCNNSTHVKTFVSVLIQEMRRPSRSLKLPRIMRAPFWTIVQVYPWSTLSHSMPPLFHVQTGCIKWGAQMSHSHTSWLWHLLHVSNLHIHSAFADFECSAAIASLYFQS